MATEDTPKEVSAPSKEEAANILANQYFNNASAAEALALVPFNTLIQLVKNQVVAQPKSEVATMTDEQGCVPRGEPTLRGGGTRELQLVQACIQAVLI